MSRSYDRGKVTFGAHVKMGFLMLGSRFVALTVFSPDGHLFQASQRMIQCQSNSYLDLSV
jgi:hypothetical protein